MAHFILEYSDNLDRMVFDPVALLGQLIDTAVETRIFPRAGCRGRAHPSADFFVADGRPSFGFVHLQVKLGAGRSSAEKDAVQVALVGVLKTHLAELCDRQGIAISLELVDLPSHKANINNIRDYLEES